MKIVTLRVFPDEGCWGLFEGPRAGRWVQCVYVIRGDAIAEYKTDLGPVEDFPYSTPLLVPSFGENTVGELMAGAERDRFDSKWYRRREEQRAASTLIPDILRQMEERHEHIAARSQFGPAISVQRNAPYSREATARKLKEMTNGTRK